MSNDDLTIKNYLETVLSKCNGDIQQKISMYEAGEAIGLEKNEAGSLAEDLIVQGLLELRTLAGEVSLTEEGLNHLGIAPPSPSQQGGQQKFSNQPVMDETDHSLTKQLIEEIKKAVSSQQLEFSLMEEIVLDLKTVETQLLSPRPKTAITKAIFGSIQGCLAEANVTPMSEKLQNCLGLNS